jgi:phosphopentomutase
MTKNFDKINQYTRQDSKKPYQRVFLVVLDGLGVGSLPDAAEFGDEGANTLENLLYAYEKKTQKNLHLPHLTALALQKFVSYPLPKNLSSLESENLQISYAKASETSNGKDSVTGHWEIAGIQTQNSFQVFPQGFPLEWVNRWIDENHLPGVLGNCTASGTEILKELGELHLASGKPILYTSADSVWQVAVHEERFGLDRLETICQSARVICDHLKVARVISRPFVGSHAGNFQRTYNRKDFAQPPPAPTYLDLLNEAGIPTWSIGKIKDIYDARGIQHHISTHGNDHGLEVLRNQMETCSKGFVFCNLGDFDTLYGHRRDVLGYGKALEAFDRFLPTLVEKLRPEDLFLVTSDHGNDPTYLGTDHTREYIPIWMLQRSSRFQYVDLGTRSTFGDIGATILEAMLGPQSSSLQTKNPHLLGRSFLGETICKIPPLS